MVVVMVAMLAIMGLEVDEVNLFYFAGHPLSSNW